MNIPFETVSADHFIPSFQSNSTRRSLKSIRGPQKKRTRNNGDASPTNPSFYDVIANALQGINAPLKDYPGYLRFTAPPSGLHYHRTLTEWIEAIKQSRQNSVAFPFTRAENEAMERHFRSQQILRRFMERCTRRKILKAIEAREHDYCDLFTTEPIPARSMVTVYDIKNRAKYTFHTTTAMKMIQTSLQYSSYGIANPSAPKNPYTNVPWTVAEMITIVRQIATNLLQNHQFPPKLLQQFRHSKYNHKTFYRENRKMLNILAAETFFSQKDDAYRDSIYEEILDDQYKELALRPRCTTLIMGTKLPTPLKKEWDNIVLALFLETNLNIFTDALKTSDDIVTAFTNLHERTLKYRFRGMRFEVKNYVRSFALEEPQYAEDNTDANWLQTIQIDDEPVVAAEILVRMGDGPNVIENIISEEVGNLRISDAVRRFVEASLETAESAETEESAEVAGTAESADSAEEPVTRSMAGAPPSRRRRFDTD
jgi:hypothetical protein